MSLRSRLVVTLLALVVLGVGIAVGALFGAVQDWASDRTDDVLTAVGDRLAAEGVADAWAVVAAESDAPSYVELRGPDGVRTLSAGRPRSSARCRWGSARSATGWCAPFPRATRR
ncbi:hypothetical protein ACFQV2_30235 [Actinokineospora soli]|uniref:Two-component system, OmpR family, sensor kinase n=1 Tax=Actinokineospora soli TaxID=1048753 RepID=A0ABW2TVU4_9PSEU